MKVGVFLEANLAKPGGVQEHARGLVKALGDQGHEAYLIGQRPARPANKVKILGRMRELRWLTKITGSSVPAVLTWARSGEIKSFLAKERFDLLHFQSPFGLLGYQLLWQAQKQGVATVATFHIFMKSNLVPVLTNLSLGPILRKLSAGLDCRIAVSRAARQFAQKMFPGEYLIIPNAVDVDRFKPEGAKIKPYLDDKKNILFVGRLDYRKGVIYVIEAFALVKRRLPNSRLVIVGRGPQGEEAKALVEKRQVQDVVFVGYVSDEDLPKFYRTADIACFPSLKDESFGIVLIEAMASGKPAVAFNIPGYREVLKGELSRFLVSLKDTEALAEALLSLLKNDSLREEYSRLGLKAAQEYSWQKVGARVVKVYQDVLSC